MSSNRVKGITVEINGSTTGLDKALSNVNRSLKDTQSKLKDVDRLLKLDPKNTVLLEQKQRLLYNKNSGEHFYTSEATEKNNLVSYGWAYEGTACIAPTSSNSPVYRLYNPNSGEHHYTMDAGEKDSLVGLGWKDEGIGWYSDDNQGTPLYRLYNPNATGQYEAGAHHYTKNMDEVNSLVALGWRSEGIGWYGKAPSAA